MTTVKKKLPYELYDVAGLEDWFSRMAAEGYHLEDCWENKAEFRVEEPKEHVRFRLEAQGTYEYDWNQDEAYAAGGWEHIATIGGFFCIFRCDDPAARELHTDPEIQSWTMKKLIRRQSFSLLFWMIYWVFLSNIRLVNTLGGLSEMISYLLTEDAILLIVGVSVLFAAHFLVVQTNQLVMLVRLKRRLASGLPMDRETRYPRSFWRHGFQWVIVGGLILSVFVGSSLYQREPVAVKPEDYPHVALEEVIPDGYWEEDLEFIQKAELKTSLLVPVQLRYTNRASLDDEQGTRARIDLDYSEAVLPGAAKLLLRGWIQSQERSIQTEREWREKYPDKFSRFALDTGPVRTPCERLDELWVWDIQYEDSDQLHRHYFGRKGTITFELTTTLPEPDMALELLIEKISS